MVMVQYGVSYRVSSRVTRAASHSRVFRTVQARYGDDALRILMSETHWAVRQSLSGANDFVAEQYDQFNLTRQGSFNEIERRDLIDDFSTQADSIQNQAGVFANDTLENTTVDEQTQNITD